MKRVAAACLVGSTIELYDFLIYRTAAALVFPTVFFPHLGAAMATTASMGTFAAAYGPMAAFLPELFATRYRYSGTALAINLAGVAGGAVPPLIADTLQATYGSWAVGLMLATIAAISLVCTYLLPETNGTALRSTRGADVVSVAS
jgi:hypothetical protein